jgi:hypothetical protein
MKSVFIGVDYIKNTDSIKLLELNTDVQISNLKESYFDYTSLFNYITQNNFAKLHFIYKETYTSPVFIQNIKNLCTENGVEYNETLITLNSILIDDIEDADDTLFFRLAYNAQAILDDYYCREHGELVNLLFENGKEAYIPKTHLQYSTEVLHDNIDSLNDNGNYPNIIAKKNYADFDKTIYPAFYKLSEETELTTLKSNLDTNIFLQEYMFSSENVESNLIVNHIRKWYLISNGLNDVIDLGGYLHSNQVPLKQDYITYSDNKLDNTGRSMFYSNPNRLSSAGVLSNYNVKKQNTDSTFTLTDIDALEVGDVVEALQISTLDPGTFKELEILNWRYTGSLESLLTYTTASVVRKTPSIVEDWFNRVEYISPNETTGSFLLQMNKMILIERGSEVRFCSAQDLEVGDIIFNSPTYTSTLTSVTDEWYSGSVNYLDIEPIDVFIAGTEDNEILSSTIVMHNYK